MVWEVRYSTSRKHPYFYNTETGVSAWERPDGISEAEANQLKGADKYLSRNKNGGEAQPTDREREQQQQQQRQREREREQQQRQARPRLKASHILAKHVGSRRPSSWREANITRSNAEARNIIKAHLDTLKSTPPDELAAKFAEIAKTESDCSSARNGGDLGWFEKGQMQASFEDVAIALPIGHLSGIVETDSGTHIIYRTA